MVTYRTAVAQTGNNTGIVVPPEILDELGAGRRVPVIVTINGFSYQSTIGSMGGRAMIALSKANREAAGVGGGDEIDVTLEHDAEVRTVEVPYDLAAALDAAGARERFDALAHSYRKEHVRSVTEAKAAETRARRITKVVDSLG
jgi:hypothetical protein